MSIKSAAQPVTQASDNPRYEARDYSPAEIAAMGGSTAEIQRALRTWGQRFETLDSGHRAEYPTGAVRDAPEGKGRFDLLPYLAIKRVAQLFERGAVKYGANNWQKGIPFSRCASSMLRHAFQAAAGETDEDHLAAVVFNALAIMQYQEEGREDLNDLPGQKGVA